VNSFHTSIGIHFFFATWQLRGKYPNKGYPNIFKDKDVGEVAFKTFNDAQNMLKDWIATKKVKAEGVVGFFAANSNGEDIELFSDDSRKQKIGVLFGLRQQVDDGSDVHLNLSDFIAPSSSGLNDFVGLFAVTTGHGINEMVELFKSKHDDFNAILSEALADRLAEALAEALHHKVRKELWGYEKNEKLNYEDLLKVKYKGIRPAPGYPSQVDHTEKLLLWDLLKVKEQVGIELTESMAMTPPSSVSGLYFASQHSRYFNVGKITKEQVESYGNRKGKTVAEIEKWLGQILSYQ